MFSHHLLKRGLTVHETPSPCEKDSWWNAGRKERIWCREYTELLYINILSMLQCLGYSLALTLQKAKNIK